MNAKFLLAAAAGLLCLAPSLAPAVPLYAARTGLPCQTCHFDPNGGGPRNEFGFAYAKNRHSIEAESEGEFKDLALRNRVADDFPLYFGVNQRFMLLADHLQKYERLDASGFFNMESGLHLTFQPHPRLTLLYSTLTAPTGIAGTRDAFGIIGLGADHYLKAGQFRVPFGLRMDDHTVATRSSFLDYQTGGRFLPFDPHYSDRGLEFGGSRGSLFARMAWTNGVSALGALPPTAGRHPQALTGKLGYGTSRWQGAASIYDEYHTSGGFGQRSSRWGTYALTHLGPVALLGEAAAGTDTRWSASGATRTNLLAAFAEANWAPHRSYNLRLRCDRVETNRSSNADTRERNSFNRYAVEGEYVPVPFAEIRWTLRLIDPVAAQTLSGSDLPSERQAYLQFHFNY